MTKDTGTFERFGLTRRETIGVLLFRYYLRIYRRSVRPENAQFALNASPNELSLQKDQHRNRIRAPSPGGSQAEFLKTLGDDTYSLVNNCSPLGQIRQQPRQYVLANSFTESAISLIYRRTEATQRSYFHFRKGKSSTQRTALVWQTEIPVLLRIRGG